MGDKDTKLCTKKVLNLRSDISLARKEIISMPNLRYQNRFDKPHRSAGATQAAPLGEEQRLLMGSHHEGDETKGSIHSSVRDYIEARKASRSVRTAGPKDLTVTLCRLARP